MESQAGGDFVAEGTVAASLLVNKMVLDNNKCFYSSNNGPWGNLLQFINDRSLTVLMRASTGSNQIIY